MSLCQQVTFFQWPLSSSALAVVHECSATGSSRPVDILLCKQWRQVPQNLLIELISSLLLLEEISTCGEALEIYSRRLNWHPLFTDLIYSQNAGRILNAVAPHPLGYMVLVHLQVTISISMVPMMDHSDMVPSTSWTLGQRCGNSSLQVVV